MHDSIIGFVFGIRDKAATKKGTAAFLSQNKILFSGCFYI